MPLVAFFGTWLLVALLAWWSGAWQSLLRGVDENYDPRSNPGLLLRSGEYRRLEDHRFWELTEAEEIAL